MCRPFAWRLAPRVMADRAYRYQVRLHEANGHYALAEAFVAEHGDAVLHGPFIGMHYPARRHASLPKRLGLYEWQLHDWLEYALSASPARFINIGASDGYYAVGAALWGLPVDAFEMAASARADIHELAHRNGVSVNVFGAATGERVRRLSLERSLVVSDCEGAEVDIFDSATVQALRTATAIIEVHGDVRPRAEQLLRERFRATHTCQRVTPGGLHHREPRELITLAPAARDIATDEMRTDHTPWLLLQPRI